MSNLVIMYIITGLRVAPSVKDERVLSSLTDGATRRPIVFDRWGYTYRIFPV